MTVETRADRLNQLAESTKAYVKTRTAEIDATLSFGEKVLSGRAGSDGLANFSLNLGVDLVLNEVKKFVGGIT